MKAIAITEPTHNPLDQTYWASGLRENFTSRSYGEGLETGRNVPRQSLTRQLDIRNIKTTLGMEVLRCLTPAMIEKELWVCLLAYNLIRLLMAQAAHTAAAPQILPLAQGAQGSRASTDT